MSIFESIGQVIGAMSKPHTSDFVVTDIYGREFKAEGIYPEQAVARAEREHKTTAKKVRRVH